MKRTILIMISFFALTFTSFAQSYEEPESAKPSYGTEIVRKCVAIDIEGVTHKDVVVTLKSSSYPDLSGRYKVKILIEDKNGKEIYKKAIKDSYLYIFPNGQIQVGKPNFDKVVIQRGSTLGATDNLKDKWLGVIREKEGVY